MLQGKLEKEPSKADMKKKIEAYKTMYQIMVKTNAEFMASLTRILKEKENQLKQLKEKADKEEATEQENATLLFLGGYVQCLKDILYAKKQEK